jgi:hypothetical protein
MLAKGKCTICSREGVLEARCNRCNKWACDSPRCLKLIRQPGQCAVPIKGERNDTGDELVAWQWLD